MSSAFIHFFQASGGARLVQLQTALLRHGLGLRLHHDIEGLCGALRESKASGAPRLVLLAGGHASSFGVARALRRADAEVAVVALLPSVSEDLLVQALRSGIDACWPEGVPTRQVAAALLRLSGRAVGATVRSVSSSSRDEGGWKLVSRAWVAEAPGGVRVTFTTAERALMLALCRAPQRQLSHAEILRAIDQVAGGGALPVAAGAAKGGESPAASSRRLSVLMSRLRRKFMAAGLDMPIRSLRGVGYELCADFPDAMAGQPAEAPGMAASLRIVAPQSAR